MTRMSRFLIALAATSAWVSASAAVDTSTPVWGMPECGYTEEWLAANHTTFDNLCTALYEARLEVEAGRMSMEEYVALSGRGDAARGVDVRMSATAPNAQNEFQIVIDPTNPQRAIGTSNDSNTAGVGIFRTTDGGLTWSFLDAPIGTSACCDPGVSYDLAGNPYVTVLDTSPAVAYVIRSTDSGATWGVPASIPLPDRQNIVVDKGATSPFQGRVYVTYSFGVGNRISVFSSTDSGATWQGPSQVGVAPAPGSQQSSDPHVASDGTLYVGFQGYQGSACPATTTNWLARSTDGGATFTTSMITGAPINQGGVCQSGDNRGYFCRNAGNAVFRSRSHPITSGHPTNPAIVYVVYSGGDLEGAYTCGAFTGRHSDTIFVKSTDGGTTWSPKLKINTDPPGNDQYYPWIDTSANGTIWVGWHDRRNDVNNFRHEWYQAFSTDEGATWTESLASDVSSQPASFIGDYAGIAASDTLVLGMWWDSRARTLGDAYTDPTIPSTGTPSNVDIVTGPGPVLANPANVKGFNNDGTANGATNFSAYGGGYGANVALANFRISTPPLYDEILTGAGPGDIYGPQVKGFARSGTAVAKINYYAYGTLKFGVNVSSGDVDDDGFDEILTGAGPGDVFGPHVRGWNFDASTLAPIAKISFFAYSTLKYGVQVGGLQFDTDGFHELATGPGPSSAFGCTVRGFNYDNVAVTSLAKVNFNPYTFVYGAHVTGGDLDQDSIEEIVTAPGPDPAASARIRGYNYDGGTVASIAGVDFDGMPGTNRYGATVDSVDLDDDLWAEIIVGTGYDPANGGPHVRGWNYDQATVTAIGTINFDAYATAQRYGVNVAVDEVGP